VFSRIHVPEVKNEMKNKQLRTIAINLPQFHPIPENDLWWGKGFTEWTNVTKAKPLFEGHYQPHLPADLGFYDMRLMETLMAQAELARQYGIHGFCYYYYWFNGKRMLNAPLDKMLSEGKPDFPFMCCWANENWTRTWDGQEQQILIKQEHSFEDDLLHIRFLIKSYFSDSRYIRVDDKPFFVIYRPSLFPDIKKTVGIWREEAEKAGLKGLYLGYMQSFNFKSSPSEFGFDCAIEFQPDFKNLPAPETPSQKEKLLKKLGISESVHFRNTLISYPKYVNNLLALNQPTPDTYKTVSPMWDNSARRQSGATIFTESSPGAFEQWLSHAAKLSMEAQNPEPFLFINAWNEWAEGNHLEPCQKYGLGYLQATGRVLSKYL
jgi:lipopolysaccharide biosynthesis protein